jgi:hypothetical protein
MILGGAQLQNRIMIGIKSMSMNESAAGRPRTIPYERRFFRARSSI